MEAGRASQTAQLAAIQRAAHVLLDDEPWIFRDDLAAALSGMRDETAVRAALDMLEAELSRAAAPSVVKQWMQDARLSVSLRARYAEDELREAMQRGVTQYVILGAGLDSFAYCRHDRQCRLRVFEVDYSATQQRKLSRLRELAIEIPQHVTYVPIDFEAESILDALERQGYLRDEAAFFSCLGVTQYLSEAAIDRTLKQIGAAASGSEIVLDYLVPPALVAESEREILRLLESLTARRGEPGRSYFEPERLAEIMKECGFAYMWDVAASEAHERYLKNRTDGLRLSPLVHLAKARIDR
jgi:methyltransferase (TIGR00027 family)